MHFDRLKSALSTERGLLLTFDSGNKEASIELSPEASDQTLRTLSVVRKAMESSQPLTLSVSGHQVARTREAYGLLLRTQEFGDVVFSLPRGVLQKLIADLRHLEGSSPPNHAAKGFTRTPAAE
jgi:hypothetical protein